MLAIHTCASEIQQILHDRPHAKQILVHALRPQRSGRRRQQIGHTLSSSQMVKSPFAEGSSATRRYSLENPAKDTFSPCPDDTGRDRQQNRVSPGQDGSQGHHGLPLARTRRASPREDDAGARNVEGRRNALKWEARDAGGITHIRFSECLYVFFFCRAVGASWLRQAGRHVITAGRAT